MLVPEIKSYEAHVTIEPVTGERFELFEILCREQKFKPAKLLMVKDRPETAERSNKDSFCTGHSYDYGDILSRMMMLVGECKLNGFKVWRYKIEGIVLDVKLDRETTI